MKHSLTWRDHTRFAYAGSATRRELGRNLAILAALLLIYGVVGAIDYATEKAIEAEGLRADVHALSRTLADCLNGNARFTTPGPHKDGYGQTAVVCRRAEEYKL